MKKFCFILLSLCLLSGCTGSSFHPYKNTDGLFEVDIQIDKKEPKKTRPCVSLWSSV